MSDHQTYEQNEELSFKDLLLKIVEFWNELWRLKLWIIVAGIVVGILMGSKYLGSPKYYEADLSFMLNDEEKPSMSFGGVLGQFGLGGMGGESNLEKILELSKTRKITQEAIFQKAVVKNKTDFLANHIIANQDSLGLWQKKKWYNFRETDPKMDIKDFRFSQDDIDNFSKKENKALKAIYNIIVGGDNKLGLLSNRYNESTGIMTLSTNSPDPNLSIALAETFFNTLSKYYIDKSVEKQQATYNIIQQKADSIHNALMGAESNLANFRDRSRGLFKNKDQLTEGQLMREIQKLNIMYGEAAKNKEMADFSLQNKTPYIQIIDAPILPLNGRKKSTLKYLIIGGLIGGFLSSAFFIFRKIIRDAMKG